MTTPETYLDYFRKMERKQFPAQQEEAINHFSRLGFPTIRNEEWRYTNILPILSHEYSFATPANKITQEEIIRRYPFLVGECFVVLENGALNSSASRLSNIPNGIEIKKLSDAKNESVFKKHYNQYAEVGKDSFAALNTAFANDGLLIHIQKNAAPSQPLNIIQVTSPVNDALIVHNRFLLIAEENSSAKLSLLTVSYNDQSEAFSNSVLEIVAEENASLELDLFQDENEKYYHLNGTYVYQANGSKFSINTVLLGGSIQRNKLHIKLDGEGCETNMHGLYLAGGTQLMDNHTAVYHAKPHSLSNELYKGVLGGKSHGVFNGKIIVERDAQKTNAYQSNKNILLSNDAVINAKPQLEIFADDVKCTHGATTGQMDDEALFYLRTRGINEVDARALLNLAFSNDILDAVSSKEFKEYIASRVETKLRQISV